jgi:Protein of unknown function (DUF1329)
MSKCRGNLGNSRKQFAATVWGERRCSCGLVKSPRLSRALKLAVAKRGLMLIVSLVVALICSLNAGVAQAQVVFSDDAYRQLAEADSPDTISVGTKITFLNWQQYKKFMPVGMQAAFSGKYPLHIGAEPTYTMEVGPAHDFAQPGDLVKNTEKYGGQATLERLPSGGWMIKGYVAGLPFPNPQEPNRGIKLLYNVWFFYRTGIVRNNNVGFLVDRYGNKSFTEIEAVFYGMSHLSVPGLPIDRPYAHGRLYSTRFQLEIPEQTKYTTELTELSDDPRQLPEVYVFLPSLRRSLRLSAAAKCSPILGTDYSQDDNSWQPTNFDVKYLGHKKLLTFIGDPNKAYMKESYVGLSKGEPASTYPGWPKYGTGLWELRNYQVIDLAWIKSLGRYCYSHTVFYVDDQMHWAPYHDNYDNGGKLWKLFHLKWAPMQYHGVTTLLYNGYAGNAMIDIENSHVSAGASYNQTLDDAVPGEYKDVEGMSSPGNLARIMK